MRHVFWLALAPAVLAAQTADTSRARRDSSQKLEAVSVSAIRANASAPVASTTLDRRAIARRAFGQDVPILLQGAPSLTSYAETANNWGYSYIRLRGIDQSRINITLDGIPLNDPEDQVLYFTDFPDLGASLGSVQIQRGVGTSAPGTASYGGSINLQTQPITGMARGVESSLQAGSLGSYRGSATFTSGAIGQHLNITARLSGLASDGYRRHSDVLGRSAFVSAAWVGSRDVVKLVSLAGLFRDNLAYVGATRAEMDADRKANILRDDEKDRFGEQVLALTHSRAISDHASMSNTAYRISTGGNYDVCIATCDQPSGDLWKFHLDFVWYGITSATTWTNGATRVTAGVNANTYARDHYAYDTPDLVNRLYTNTGHKRDASGFVKVERDVGRATLFGDLQGRHATFEYSPDAAAGLSASDISWSFLNPKAGVTVRMTPVVSLYGSYGVNGREPARNDMLGGFDNITSADTSFVGPLSRVNPEHVRDLEAGVRHRTANWSLDIGAFAMSFRDEILPIGQLSYIGSPLRKNVSSSWRRGIELDASRRFTSRVQLGTSATFMKARIAEYTDDADSSTHRNVPPLLTPAITSTQRATFDVTPALSLSLIGRGVGKSFLNNTGTDALSLPPQYTIDLSAQWTRGNRAITLFVNNATDSRLYASGHVSGGEARYYVLPPLNVHLLVRIGSP